jgi:hypothetical protein
LLQHEKNVALVKEHFTPIPDFKKQFAERLNKATVKKMDKGW